MLLSIRFRAKNKAFYDYFFKKINITDTNIKSRIKNIYNNYCIQLDFYITFKK